MPAIGSLVGGRYRLESVLARSASAVVYRSVDVVLNHRVALEVLLPNGLLSIQQNAAARLRFRTEAVSAMGLSHPSILRVYDYQHDGPWEFLVTEFVAGETLRRHVNRRSQKRLTTEETISLAVNCLDALEYAQGVGVLHGNLNPDNLLILESGEIKVCNFGLSRLVAKPPRGQTDFISPEVLDGRPGDERSDLFSLAATLYAVGDGQLFHRSARGAWETPPPSRHLPFVLHEVLSRAAATAPYDRFASAREMREALLEAARVMQAQQARFAVDFDAVATREKPEVIIEIEVD